jgi:sulfur-oxidizing protein SoxZ
MSSARLQLPPRIVEGDVFKLRLLVNHPMDSGFLRDIDGVATSSVNSVAP